MSVSAQEWQVVDEGDVYEVVSLLYDPGDGFKVVAAVFGDEDVRRGLSSDTEQPISTHNVHSISFFFFGGGWGCSLHPKIASKERLLDSLELMRNQQENFPRVSHLALPMLLRLSSLAMSAFLTTAGGDDITNHSSA